MATGVLSAGEVAPPIRTILQKYPNADVRLGRVVEVNAEENTVVYEASGTRHTLGYRSLIAATGATQAYFGHDEFEKVTYKLKTVEDAEVLRKQILRCFEEAHTTNDALVRRNLLSFVVVGAGATGVELAGQIKGTGASLLRQVHQQHQRRRGHGHHGRGRGRCASGLRRQAQ